MADRVATQDGNWNDTATWGGADVPTISETVHLLTFDVTANVVAACASLTGGTGSELILTKNNFTCAGAMTLDWFAVTTLGDMSDVVISATNFDIGADGSLTLSDDLILDLALGGFELDGGVLDMGSNDMLITGDIVYSSGTLSNPGTITQGGTSDLAWLNASPSLTYAQAAGSIISLITASFTVVNSFTQPADATLQSSEGRILLVRDTSAGWWNALGTVNVEVQVVDETSGPGSDIILTDKPLAFYSNSTHTLTIDANIELGTGELSVYGAGAANSMTLDMEANSLTCAVALLGSASTTGDGKLDLGEGVHSIGEIKGHHADNADNTLALGTCRINDMVAGIDGTLIDTVTVTAAHLYGNGSSTIKNVDVSAAGTIYCHGFDEAGSTGNDGDIRFVGAGGGRMLLGVGT